MQLDELLTALQTNDRESLQDLLNGLGDGLNGKPTAADDRGPGPERARRVRSQVAERLDRLRAESLKGSAQVNRALLGTRPHDLSKLIAGLDKITTALGTNEEQLKDLITNFNRFFAIFADSEQNVNESIRLLGPTVETARDSLRSLNAALPEISGLRARHHPRRARDAGDDHRRDPVDLPGRASVRALRAGQAARLAAAGDRQPGERRRPPRAASSRRPTSPAGASTR